MVRSVLRVDTSASRAALARIARIDCDQRDAATLALVFEEGAELPEGPVPQASALFAAGRNLSANAVEFFNGDSASSAFGIQHDSLRYAVVRMFLEPRLLPGEFDEPPLGGPATDALQNPAALGVASADTLDVSTGIDLTVTGGGDIDDTEIDADPVARLELFGLWDVARRGQHPLAAHEAEIDPTLSEGEQIALLLTGDVADPHPAFEGPDRHHVLAFEAEDAVIVGLGGVGAEDGRDFAIDLEGVSDLGDAAHGRLRRQAELGASLDVGQLVEIELPEDARRKAFGRDGRARLVAAFERRPKDDSLLARRLQLDGGDQLHFSNIDDFSDIARTRLAASAIPPRPEGRGFSRRI